jgi:hypothetical protein
MPFDLTESADILRRTPAVLDALLRDTTPFWHAQDEGPETWSPIVVVGHLIHADETDWLPRARIILEHGSERPFDPFDRFAQLSRFANWSLERLLDRFAEVRRESLETLAGWHLTAEQLALPGRHPELGAVTLGQLLSTWVVHDFNHLTQIARVMAKRYESDVGVWQAYLPVLRR